MHKISRREALAGAAGGFAIAGKTARAQVAGRVVLARDGRAAASIVVADAASPAERSAAGELASYLRKITGAVFPVRAASLLISRRTI